MTDEAFKEVIKNLIRQVEDTDKASEIIFWFAEFWSQRRCVQERARQEESGDAARRTADRERKRRQREGAPDVSPRLRFEILRRDGHRCTYCGVGSDTAEMHIDHVIPRSRGGETVPQNLVTACGDCNRGKGDLV